MAVDIDSRTNGLRSGQFDLMHSADSDTTSHGPPAHDRGARRRAADQRSVPPGSLGYLEDNGSLEFHLDVAVEEVDQCLTELGRTLWGAASQPYVNGVERIVLPDGTEGVGLAFAGHHQVNQIWCDEGACECGRPTTGRRTEQGLLTGRVAPQAGHPARRLPARPPELERRVSCDDGDGPLRSGLP